MQIQIQMTRKNSNDALKFKKRAKKFKYELGLELKSVWIRTIVYLETLSR